MGLRCYRIKQLEKEQNIPILEDLDARIRKIELDLNLVKNMLRNDTKVHYRDDPIERIKFEEQKKISDPKLSEYRKAFGECIQELKIIINKRFGVKE